MDSNHIFNQRLETLAGLCRGIAQVVTQNISEKYEIAAPIRFVGGEPFREINLRYWALVRAFKKAHQFDEDRRINSPKKAALTVYAAMSSKGSLFETDDKNLVEKDLIIYCEVRYAIEVMQLFMGLNDGDIRDEHIHALCVGLLSIGKFDSEVKLSDLTQWCVYMDVYWRGHPAKTSQSRLDEPLNDGFDVPLPEIVIS